MHVLIEIILSAFIYVVSTSKEDVLQAEEGGGNYATTGPGYYAEKRNERLQVVPHWSH